MKFCNPHLKKKKGKPEKKTEKSHEHFQILSGMFNLQTEKPYKKELL